MECRTGGATRAIAIVEKVIDTQSTLIDYYFYLKINQ